MSFAMTTDALVDGIKDVTRRCGWWNLKVGEKLKAVKKSQGLKKGEKIEVLGIIEIVSTRAERLDRMITEPEYGMDEIRREGFQHHPERSQPAVWVPYFCEGHGCAPDTVINRIEFKFTRVDQVAGVGELLPAM